MTDCKPVPVGRPQIREVFLRNGFAIAPDRDDLEDAVYEAAFELLEMAAPDVQGEPVAWIDIASLPIDPEEDQVFWFGRTDGYVEGPRAPQYGGYDYEEFDFFCPALPPPLYTVPQPAGQHPASDVVSQIIKLIDDECRYWHGQDEARRGGYAILYAKVKELNSKQQPVPVVDALEQAGSGVQGELVDDAQHVRAMELFKPPFRYDSFGGYIRDSENNRVADNRDLQDDAVLRIRGWGRISYMDNPETLQDKIGELIATALTAYWTQPEGHQMDVSGLVEALEDIAGTHHHSASAGEFFAKVAREALAAYRKGGDV